MEAMSSVDAVFLAIEDECNPMNIGTVALFDGPPPPFDGVRRFLAGRIMRVPRCGQRVREPTGLLGRPVWIDAVGFAPIDHVRATSLSDQDGALDRFVADLFVEPLDRRRPLWEVWVVTGLADDRWALVAKVHHCMVDGIAGNELLSAILPDAPDDDLVTGAGPPPDAWVAAPEPSRRAVARFHVTSGLRTLVGHGRTLADAVAHPGRSWTQARRVVVAARRLWYRQPHLRTSLTGTIGPSRRWAHVTVPLADVAAIRSALGGTVNDVVLAAVTSGFRELMVARGEPVHGRTLTAMVPVSLRSAADRGRIGNRVANVHALLPIGDGDPRSTLRTVHAHLDELRDSHEIEATGLLLRVGDYVPRAVADRVARAVLHRQRNVETVITNVPGPRHPLYLGRHRMLAGYPVAPIAGRVRITVAIWSYCDQLSIGITGDRDTVPDLDRLGRAIADGVAVLLEAAQTA